MQTRKIFYRYALILAMLFPLVLWSQTEVQTNDLSIDYPKHLSIGLKSGVTYSSLSIGIPIQKMSGFTEPSYGIIFSYVHARIVGIQFELNYLTKSWEENPEADYLFKANMNYLEIPMLTTLHFGNKLKFIVNFGPYLSILLKEESSHTVAETSDYFQYYNSRNPHKGDFGIMSGAGFRFQSKLGLFQVEARYTFGFQNIYDSVESNLQFSNLTTIGVFLSYQYLFSNGR